MLLSFEQLDQDNVNVEIGKKAASLITLHKLGLNVPDGAVIPGNSLEQHLNRYNINGEIQRLDSQSKDRDKLFESARRIQTKILETTLSNELLNELESFVSHHPDWHYAVRSSATKEDLINTSFAGMYDSYLNVQGISALVENVKSCWASLYNRRVLEYCINNQIPISQLGMSVIIQRMIPATKSGVLFSVNPLTANDKEMLIEACWGLGESLVSGRITPNSYLFNWYESQSKTIETGLQTQALIPTSEHPFTRWQALEAQEAMQPVLNNSELRELGQQALKVQQHYGFPVDIEWTFSDGVFHFVQTRPITSINYDKIHGEWTTADFKDGGVSSSVCSCFMWSLYDYIWESTTPSYARDIHILPDYQVKKWGEMYFSRPYWNLGAAKDGLKKIPGFSEVEFNQDLGIETLDADDNAVTKLTVRSLIHGARVLYAINQRKSGSLRKLHSIRKTQEAKFAEYDKYLLHKTLDEPFIEFYKKLVNDDYFQSESTYFHHIYTTTNLTSLFKESLSGINTQYKLVELVSSLSNMAHLTLNFDIWDLSRKINGDSVAKKFWYTESICNLLDHLKSGSKDYQLDLVTRLISKHNYHSTRELDITVPRFSEDPEFIIQNIKQNIMLPDSKAPRYLNDIQKVKHQKILTLFEQDIPWYKRKKVIKQLQELRSFLWWREELRDLSTHFYYYIRLFTLKIARQLQSDGILNKEEDIFHLSKDSIISILENKTSQQQIDDLLYLNKTYYESFRHFRNPNEMGGKYSALTNTSSEKTLSDKSNLTGIACSSGQFVGRIKIISDIFDADRLEQDDILITQYTDPGWTSKFGLIGAVATETGGVLSHAAVISREYGIPAVLAVKDITNRLIEGQKVKIDGTSGTITILEV
jgi:phosphohistidine swiveling domain-containing protein